MDDAHSPIQPVLVLRRVEAKTNAARFYALMIERDLFGRVVLVRRWGRIGTQGRERTDPHVSEAGAAEALTKLAAAKRRRGYRDL
jgi:predicted DNA-binding WGR domain protein